MATPDTQTLKHTPFNDFHERHGAKFVDFAGWRMPINYGSIIDEHHQVRQRAGLFDVSHMGRVKVTGRHARRFLERVLSRRVSNMKEFTCRYSMVCNEQGGVKDDILVYRYPEHWLLVVNAANRAKLLEHFAQQKGDLICEIDDQTESTAMVAVQGPQAIELVSKFSSEIPTLKRFQFREKNLMVLKMTVSRTGYSGEDGIEVMLGANMASMALKLLMKEGDENATLQPCGLGCRDTLRTEAALPLYGHELAEDIDPLSAGLSFAVSLDKDQDENGEPFVGQEALKRIQNDGPPHELIGLSLDGKRTPRQNHVVMIGDTQKGYVTSGCLSPTLGHPIAMAFVERGACQVGDAAAVQIGSKTHEAKVVELPFYKPGQA
jgi:aminomethyltransferase